MSLLQTIKKTLQKGFHKPWTSELHFPLASDTLGLSPSPLCLLAKDLLGGGRQTGVHCSQGYLLCYQRSFQRHYLQLAHNRIDKILTVFSTLRQRPKWPDYKRRLVIQGMCPLLRIIVTFIRFVQEYCKILRNNPVKLGLRMND